MRTRALPRLAAQRAYQVAVNGLPVGERAGTARCPCCAPTHGPLAPHQEENCEHIVMGCAVSRLLWALILTPWTAHVDGQAWTGEFTAQTVPRLPLSKQARRALILGQRPTDQQQHPEAFALLRGLVISSLIDHRNERAAAKRLGSHNTVPPQEAAQKLYTKIRRALGNALACDLRHTHAMEQCYHVRGQKLPPCTPTRQWRDTWEETGFAERVQWASQAKATA